MRSNLEQDTDLAGLPLIEGQYLRVVRVHTVDHIDRLALRVVTLFDCLGLCLLVVRVHLVATGQTYGDQYECAADDTGHAELFVENREREYETEDNVQCLYNRYRAGVVQFQCQCDEQQVQG